MDSEKLEVIKKIAMSCVEKNKPHCRNCPKGHENDIVLTCRSLLKDILTLINEFENENEWLVGKIKEKNSESADCLLKTQQLKDRIAEMEEDKEKWQRKAINYYQMAKSYGIECIIDNDIDETLKEFYGKV